MNERDWPENLFYLEEEIPKLPVVVEECTGSSPDRVVARALVAGFWGLIPSIVSGYALAERFGVDFKVGFFTTMVAIAAGYEFLAVPAMRQMMDFLDRN